jgi:hypothetical protein
MTRAKRLRLTAGGWRTGTVAEFLGLRQDEEQFIGMKLALAHAVRERRLARGWSQVEAAKWLGSSQSRVAKMEAGDVSVSLDLLVRSLLGLGAKPEEVAGSLRRPVQP